MSHSGRLDRLLFASTHGLFDLSSGAALATRDVLELLAARGVDCRALSTGVLDFERERPLEEVLAAAAIPFARAEAQAGAGPPVAVLDLEPGGVRATLLPTASSRAGLAPSRDEGARFLDLAEVILERFRPQVLLSYGGHPADVALRRRARARGIPVAFHLHNFGYGDARAFAEASAVVVPSRYSARFHQRTLGIDCVVLPYPLRRDRVVAADPDPRYVTFVNPQLTKGAGVVARIALELQARRPEIPLLVVEARGGADALAELPVDLAGLANLHRMAVTPEPRDFWRATRIALAPSLWRESFGRVAAEAMANGLPVLASDRGALPETLGDAGFCFTVPERCTPTEAVVPTAREVAPWVAAIERLWDDPAFAALHRERSLAEAARWDAEHAVEAFAEALGGLAWGTAGSHADA